MTLRKVLVYFERIWLVDQDPKWIAAR